MLPSIDEFLRLACLRYDATDDPALRKQAEQLLVANPAWKASSVHVAAVCGDDQALGRHLDQDRSLVYAKAGTHGWSPLMALAYSRVTDPDSKPDFAACARRLLAAGADPTDSFPLGPCTFAVLTGVIGHGEGGPLRLPPHAEAEALAPMLLRAGAAANDPQGLYNTMLSPGNRWLRLLIEHGLKPEDTINWGEDGAVRQGSMDFVLAHAAKEGNLERATLLLDHGADPNVVCLYDNSPAHTRARLHGHRELAALLEERGATPPPLSAAQEFQLACFEIDAARAQELLAADPGLLQPKHLTEAAAYGRLDEARLLLDLGADVNGDSGGGVTPLHQAGYSGHLAMIELLLARGGDRTLRDRRHQGLPMGWAQHAGQTDAAARLDPDGGA